MNEKEESGSAAKDLKKKAKKVTAAKRLEMDNAAIGWSGFLMNLWFCADLLVSRVCGVNPFASEGEFF